MLATALLTSQAWGVELQAGDTSVNLYGFAKLDILYDVGDIRAGTRGMGKSIGFENIGLEGQTTTSGHSDLHADESRLGVRTRTPTEQGDLLVNIEGDFWTGNLRLRQAYGSWNGITAGQTWSNFHTFVSTTPTLDFTGPAGRDAFFRQAQLRYSYGNFHIALEDPSGAMSGSSYDGGYSGESGGRSIAGTDVDRKDSLPDLTLRYESSMGDLKYSAAALLRDIAFDDGAASDSVTAWGLFLAGSIELTPGTTLRGQITGGDGLGAYMKLNPAPAAYRVGDELETIFSWGGTLGISHDIGPGSLNLAYSYVEADWDDALADGIALVNEGSGNAYDHKRDLIHLNYMWQPTKNVTYGIEVAHAARTAVDDREGDATRIQGSVIYAF
nr:DcaP family trimeric outer membrane transporter [Halomonas aerodenitrificans]